jgi:hypothetical protein
VLAEELHVRTRLHVQFGGGAIEILVSFHARELIRQCIISYNIALCAPQTLPATDIANYIEPGIRSVLLMMYHA